MARITPALISTAVALLAGAALDSCGSGSTCGLALAERIDFPKERDAVGEVACCGDFQYRDRQSEQAAAD